MSDIPFMSGGAMAAMRWLFGDEAMNMTCAQARQAVEDRWGGAVAVELKEKFGEDTPSQDIADTPSQDIAEPSRCPWCGRDERWCSSTDGSPFRVIRWI